MAVSSPRLDLDKSWINLNNSWSIWWQSGKKMQFFFHLFESYKEFEKGSVSGFQSSGFSNSLQLKAILLWLKMEVSTQAGYKLPTEGIAILNYFQSPNKFSRMEICLYPYFLSPEMIFVLLIMNHTLHSFLLWQRRISKCMYRLYHIGFCFGHEMYSNKIIIWKIWLIILKKLAFEFNNYKIMLDRTMKIHGKCFVDFRSPQGLAVMGMPIALHKNPSGKQRI